MSKVSAPANECEGVTKARDDIPLLLDDDVTVPDHFGRVFRLLLADECQRGWMQEDPRVDEEDIVFAARQHPCLAGQKATAIWLVHHDDAICARQRPRGPRRLIS